MLAIACLLAVVAVAAAGPAPQQFHSAKFETYKIRNNQDNQEESPLTQHTFQTRLDHFQPQDGRVVNFVSLHHTAILCNTA